MAGTADCVKQDEKNNQDFFTLRDVRVSATEITRIR